MSIVILEFTYEYYLMECPAFVAKRIGEYQQKFDAWMGDRSNDHGYWVSFEPESYFAEKGFPDPHAMRSTDGKDGLSYGEDAFVDWLNRFVLRETNEKAKIISAHNIDKRNEKGHAKFPDEYNYPHLFF